LKRFSWIVDTLWKGLACGHRSPVTTCDLAIYQRLQAS
jgi:hypothetical protein